MERRANRRSPHLRRQQAEQTRCVTETLKCLWAIRLYEVRNKMEAIQKTDAEVIQEEAEDPSVSVEAPGSSGPSVEAAGLQNALDTVANGFDVAGFKCGKCGLAHMHDTTKHRASDSFDMSEEEAADMEFDPNCHCGVQELGRHGSDYGVDESDAARTAGSAPIPDETAREMNEAFGSL